MLELFTYYFIGITVDTCKFLYERWYSTIFLNTSISCFCNLLGIVDRNREPYSNVGIYCVSTRISHNHLDDLVCDTALLLVMFATMDACCVLKIVRMKCIWLFLPFYNVLLKKRSYDLTVFLVKKSLSSVDKDSIKWR